jgi:hypothetical protein
MYKNLQILRENPETANAGKKWSEEEINELLNERKEDKSIDNIMVVLKKKNVTKPSDELINSYINNVY